MLGISTAAPQNCPAIQKEDQRASEHLLDHQPQYFYSPSALASLLCLCNVKEGAAPELRVEAVILGSVS